MDLKIHVTVHAYAEEELRDEVLVPHSGNYGILGKEIVAPLRRINGKSFSIRNVEADFSITNLWDWIDKRIYEIGVLQTKVNSQKEKSPAKFARPKMGTTKQAGEKCIASRDGIGS